MTTFLWISVELVRHALRLLLAMLGTMLIMAGGLWTLQGLGLVMWPAESFMLADRQWALRGALVVLLGIGMIWFARRIGKRRG